MKKQDLVKVISESTKLGEEKAKKVVNELILNRSIPTVIQDKVISNIADGADITETEARLAVSSIYGEFAEQPAMFEVISEQLVGAWINDCDGCNACGEKLTRPVEQSFGRI